MTNANKAYNRGRKARARKKTGNHNPYPINTSKYMLWNLGYCNG